MRKSLCVFVLLTAALAFCFAVCATAQAIVNPNPDSSFAKPEKDQSDLAEELIESIPGYLEIEADGQAKITILGGFAKVLTENQWPKEFSRMLFKSGIVAEEILFTMDPSCSCIKTIFFLDTAHQKIFVRILNAYAKAHHLK
jgi:hypothetical protein